MAFWGHEHPSEPDNDADAPLSSADVGLPTVRPFFAVLTPSCGA